MAHAFRWYRLSIFLVWYACSVGWTETYDGDIDRELRGWHDSAEVGSLCPDAKLHMIVSKL
jgi:hypothetical protein